MFNVVREEIIRERALPDFIPARGAKPNLTPVPNLSHVALVASFPPRRCGIATFTADVHEQLVGAAGLRCDVVAIAEDGDDAQHEAVRHVIRQDALEDYERAARALNADGVELVCVQHEFGIFGGSAGDYLLAFLDVLTCPVVITLHTVLEQPNEDQSRVMAALLRRASRVIVMAERGRRILIERYNAHPEKVAVIPHGAPDHPLIEPNEAKPRFGLDARAKELGLVDAVADGDLLSTAVAVAERAIGTTLRRSSTLTDKIEGARGNLALFDEAKDRMNKQKRGFEAPQKCIECVRAAVTLPFEEGMKVERTLFEELRKSDQSKAQRHVFFAEREVAKIPDVPSDTPTRPIKSVAVIGAGTMGSGIAIACLNAGLEVRLMDREQAFVDKGLGVIDQTFAGNVKRGRITEARKAETMARVRGITRYEDLADVDLVIEAVFEEMPIKKAVFTELDRVCKPGAILGTNTSTLDVDEIAAVTKRPEDVIGLHFFSPANIMKLLEIVRGKKTSKDVIATSMKLGKTLEKVGVLVGVCHGFVGNRILYQYRREALFLLEEGATPMQVDKAIQDFGFAMGPFAMSDLAGLDIGWRVRKAQGKPVDERYSGTIPDRLCEQGHFGQKTGQGYYKYEAGSRAPRPYPELEQLVLDVSKELGLTRRSISDAEIVERCIYPMINEGCRILEEGIALRASDIDMVWIHGYGFPAYRGGPMFYGELVGLPKVYETIERLHQQHGKVWAPSPLLEKLAKSGKSFAEG